MLAEDRIFHINHAMPLQKGQLTPSALCYFPEYVAEKTKTNKQK